MGTLLDFILTKLPSKYTSAVFNYKLENGGDVYQRRKGPYADAGSSDSEGQEVGSRQQDGAGQTGSSWRRIVLLILAITIHNIPEGLAVGVWFGAIGKTSSATFESARNLAIGIGIQNIPEGLAVSLPLRGAGMSTWKAFWYGQLSGMVEPIAGLLGAVAVVLAEPLLPYALTFASGAMVYVVVDDIIPEAQLSGNGKLASWTSILGFVVMMSLDVSACAAVEGEAEERRRNVAVLPERQTD
ncbi:zinc transporter ZIP11-like [Salvelinus namaycush]|uniref:Zinc transporter ZIP11 n=1 Tax=Salvelinus namaycush TaxID=8040 RepID=A0A8U0PW49_SALNM|nr:zinc transporter ZIP11-like [Salvelinus namaycush]